MAAGLAACAAFFATVTSPTAQATETPPQVPPISSPATVLSFSLFNSSLRNEMQGLVCKQPNICTTVRYPAFALSSGVTALERALATTSADKIIVYGYSNGAEVAEAWLVKHANDPDAPPQDKLSFVLFGNPTKPVSNNQPEEWAQSHYQIIDVARQYDGIADLPNNKESKYYRLALMNANIGFLTIHPNYNRVNINDPANAVWQVGNVTYVRTPTKTLPILGMMGSLFPSLNERMKAQIETAYIRPVPFPTPGQPAPLPTGTVVPPPVDTGVVSITATSPQRVISGDYVSRSAPTLRPSEPVEALQESGETTGDVIEQDLVSTTRWDEDDVAEPTDDIDDELNDLEATGTQADDVSIDAAVDEGGSAEKETSRDTDNQEPSSSEADAPKSADPVSHDNS